MKNERHGKQFFSKRSTLSIDQIMGGPGPEGSQGTDDENEAGPQVAVVVKGGEAHASQGASIPPNQAKIAGEANCQVSVTSRNCGGEGGAKRSNASPRRQAGRDEQARRKRRSPASSALKSGLAQAPKGAGWNRPPHPRDPTDGRTAGELNLQQPQIPKLDLRGSSNADRPHETSALIARLQAGVDQFRERATRVHTETRPRGGAPELRDSRCDQPSGSACLMNQHDYQIYLGAKVRWSTSRADQVFTLDTKRNPNAEGFLQGSQMSADRPSPTNATRLLPDHGAPQERPDRQGSREKMNPSARVVLPRASPPKQLRSAQQAKSPPSTGQARQDPNDDEDRRGAVSSGHQNPARPGWSGKEGSGNFPPASSKKNSQDVDLFQMTTQLISGNFEQYNRFAKVSETNEIDQSQKRRIMEWLLKESERIQREGRENAPQDVVDRRPDGQIEKDPQIANILTRHDRDELELENYVQQRLQQPPETMAGIDLKQNVHSLRNQIKTQGANPSIGSPLDNEFQKSLLSDGSTHAEFKSRRPFVFSPKCAIYGTNNSFVSGQVKPANYQQHDGAPLGQGVSISQPNGAEASGPQTSTLSGGQSFQARYGGGGSVSAAPSHRHAAYPRGTFSGSTPRGMDRQQLYLAAQQNRRNNDVVRKTYEVSKETPLLHQLIMTKSGNKKMCQRELRNMLRLMNKQKWLGVRPHQIALMTGQSGQPGMPTASGFTGTNMPTISGASQAGVPQDQRLNTISVHAPQISEDLMNSEEPRIQQRPGGAPPKMRAGPCAVTQPTAATEPPAEALRQQAEGQQHDPPSESSKAQSIRNVTQPTLSFDANRKLYSSPQDHQNLQNLSKEWGFSAADDAQKSLTLSGPPTIRSKFDAYVGAATTAASKLKNKGVWGTLPTPGTPEDPANISYMCLQMKQRFINEKRLKTQRGTVRDLSRKLHQWKRDNNHVLVRREYQYRTINHKNKWGMLLPNDDVHNGGYLEKFSPLVVPELSVGQSLHEKFVWDQVDVATQRSKKASNALSAADALRKREEVLKKSQRVGYTENKIRQQASQIAQANGLDQSRAEEVEQMSLMYDNYYDAYQKYEDFQIIKDVDKALASKMKITRKPELAEISSGVSSSRQQRQGPQGADSAGTASVQNQIDMTHYDYLSTHRRLQHGSSRTPRSPDSFKPHFHGANNHNITVRDYQEAQDLGNAQSNYTENVKSGDLASNKGGLGGGDSSTVLAQARYPNQAIEHDWQTSLYSHKEALSTNSRQFEVGGHRISPPRSHRRKDQGADQANENADHRRRTHHVYYPTATKIPIVATLVAGKKQKEPEESDIVPSIAVRATIADRLPDSPIQEEQDTALLGSDGPLGDRSTCTFKREPSKQNTQGINSSEGNRRAPGRVVSLHSQAETVGGNGKEQLATDQVYGPKSGEGRPQGAKDSGQTSAKQQSEAQYLVPAQFDRRPNLGAFTESDGQILNQILSQQNVERMTHSSHAPRTKGITGGYDQLRNLQGPLLNMNPALSNTQSFNVVDQKAPGYAGGPPAIGSYRGGTRLSPKVGNLKLECLSPTAREVSPTDAAGFYELALRQGSVRGHGALIKPNESSSQRQKNTLVARSVITKKVQEAKLRLEKLERLQRGKNINQQVVQQQRLRAGDQVKELIGFPVSLGRTAGSPQNQVVTLVNKQANIAGVGSLPSGQTPTASAVADQRSREWGQLGLKTYELPMAAGPSPSGRSLPTRQKNTGQGSETPQRTPRREQAGSNGINQNLLGKPWVESKQPPAPDITTGEQSFEPAPEREAIAE